MPARSWCSGCHLLAAAVAALMALSAREAAPAPPYESAAPAKGSLLVASRNLPDPNFRRTVVLILEHDEDGSFGLVINRRTGIKLARAAPQLKGVAGMEYLIALGGPVGRDALTFLVRSKDAPEHSLLVVDDIYFSAHRETLEDILSRQLPSTELQVYAGHAGWASGQLHQEIQRGDWHVASSESASFFGEKADALWNELIGQFEPRGLMVETRPSGWIAVSGKCQSSSGGRWSRMTK